MTLTSKQLTSEYRITHKAALALTVPRALSRIHRITKYTLKMADIHFRRITRKVITEVVVAVLSLRRMVNLTTRCISGQWGKKPQPYLPPRHFADCHNRKRTVELNLTTYRETSFSVRFRVMP
ncbi:hypothetical protein OF868_03825 [Escherichia coli]|nr:hypothetical protein OF868_03825 [Escherichia coli]